MYRLWNNQTFGGSTASYYPWAEEKVRVLGWMRGAVFLFAVMATSACQKDLSKLDVEIISGNSNDRGWGLAYGREDGRLVFAVLVRGDGPIRIPVVLDFKAGNRGLYRVTLDRPDGTKISLPSGVQLYDYDVQGEFKEYRQRVSLGQLQRFWRSEPAEFSVKCLLRLAKETENKGSPK